MHITGKELGKWLMLVSCAKRKEAMRNDNQCILLSCNTGLYVYLSPTGIHAHSFISHTSGVSCLAVADHIDAKRLVPLIFLP
jgi:hypothetical protein